jgi:phenylpropionate dioxygenase-like ring-hydroxylating dioxygenase large terminal subunit
VISTDALIADLAARAVDDDNWHTLPPQAYCSQEVFDLEVDRVFRRGWMNVGHVSQIPNAGDFRTVDMFGELLVITRGRDGEINVMSRVCPHRWMDICAGSQAGNVPSLQCPYHLWTFSHDGRLRAAPEMDSTPGFDKDDYPLTPFRHEVWEGFIYVNLDSNAPPTSELWGPLSTQLSEYGLADWVVASSTAWGESGWVWKVFIDYGECFLHIGIHQDTLEPFMPARRSVDLANNGEYTLVYANGSDDVLIPSDDGQLEFFSEDPSIDGLNEQQRIGLGLAYPFPNYVIAIMPQYAVWFEVVPLGPGRIDLTTHIMLPPHLVEADGSEERIAAHTAAAAEIHEQDIVVCEGVQRGLQAASSKPGMLCHLEGHNRSFAKWYARQISTL